MRRNSKEFKMLRLDIAKSAMQAMLSNPVITSDLHREYLKINSSDPATETMNHIVEASFKYAEALMLRNK